MPTNTHSADTAAYIETLLEAMTLEEQVALLSGADFWITVPVERLGIPAIKVTDGPNGARGGGALVGGVSAACFPVGISLAATWNTILVEQVGQKVVQLYVHDRAAHLARPRKELKGFAKLALTPGETTTATLTLDRQALAYWDDAQQAWLAEDGAFEVLVGSSSQDIRARAEFQLTETVAFGGLSNI